jgi:hypothetical protein
MIMPARSNAALGGQPGLNSEHGSASQGIRRRDGGEVRTTPTATRPSRLLPPPPTPPTTTTLPLPLPPRASPPGHGRGLSCGPCGCRCGTGGRGSSVTHRRQVHERPYGCAPSPGSCQLQGRALGCIRVRPSARHRSRRGWASGATGTAPTAAASLITLHTCGCGVDAGRGRSRRLARCVRAVEARRHALQLGGDVGAPAELHRRVLLVVSPGAGGGCARLADCRRGEPHGAVAAAATARVAACRASRRGHVAKAHGHAAGQGSAQRSQRLQRLGHIGRRHVNFAGRCGAGRVATCGSRHAS